MLAASNSMTMATMLLLVYLFLLLRRCHSVGLDSLGLRFIYPFLATHLEGVGSLGETASLQNFRYPSG